MPLQSEKLLVFPAPDAPQKGGANANGSVPLRRLSENYWGATGAGGNAKDKTRDTVGRTEQSRRGAALRNATGFLNLVADSGAFADMHRQHVVQEAGNAILCHSHEKFHTVV